jgi:predicted metallopeptidase
MRYPYIFASMLFLSIILSTGPVLASAEFVSPHFAAPLMNWVAKNMQVRVPYLPRIVVSRNQMIALIGNPQRQAAMARALYVPNMVVIDEEFWDASNTRTVSFLVHELVHHAQQFSGKKYPCANAKEREAYSLQNIWLAEHNLPPAVEDEWIVQMAQCNPASSRTSLAVK